MRWIAVTSSALTGLLVAGWMALAAPPGVINAYNAICDASFPTRCASVAADGTLKTTAGGGGTSGVKATAADPAYVEGSTGNPVSSDLLGYQRVLDKQGSTPWVVTGSGGAGLPAAGVVSVQGIAGGQPIPISGNIGQGSPPWTVRGNDTASDGSTQSNVLRTFAQMGVYSGVGIDLVKESANGLNSVGVGLAPAQAVGQCDDVSPTAITENNFGNARINCQTHAQLVEVLPSGPGSTGAGIGATISGGLSTGQLFSSTAAYLYGAEVVTTSVAGYFLVLNLSAVPGAGAVLPWAACWAPASGTCALQFNPPMAFSTGVVGVFSTAATPYTYTPAGPSQMFSAQVK